MFESIAKTNTTQTVQSTVTKSSSLRVLLKQIQHKPLCTNSQPYICLRVLLKQIQHKPNEIPSYPFAGLRVLLKQIQHKPHQTATPARCLRVLLKQIQHKLPLVLHKSN